MRIVTFNLRFENDNDGLNGWSYRRKSVARLIERYAPSILGTQEGKLSQLSYLQENLPAYAIHTPDRIRDDVSQCPTLFIKHDAFEVLEGKEEWLSKTPDVHLSKDWDSAFPRMMSYAKLLHKESSTYLWVAVTHLDHIGIEARYNQAKIIANWAKNRKGPVILMGDFNDNPGSPVHEVLTAPDTTLQDTWQILKRKENQESFTNHGFDGIPQKTRMDWALVSPHFHVTDAAIIRDNVAGRYPSDHFPYCVDLEWEKG
ncbi:MAG: endonuclease/exonuclease/phosphatase family protein [Deltaproteobacteria bacterium]|nr:endonuclease/exonuclease/phosphatase family protein [Deltaproteobacteria bacterium]